MKTLLRMAIVCVAIVVASLVTPALAAPAAASDRKAIEAVIGTYGDALTAADVDAVLALYSGTPVFMPEYAPQAQGRAAVPSAYESVFATLKLNGRFVIHEVEVVGDQAWARTSSTGRFTVIATGVEAPVNNSELFLFKREGKDWKIHRYMFTSAAPLSR